MWFPFYLSPSWNYIILYRSWPSNLGCHDRPFIPANRVARTRTEPIPARPLKCHHHALMDGAWMWDKSRGKIPSCGALAEGISRCPIEFAHYINARSARGGSSQRHACPRFFSILNSLPVGCRKCGSLFSGEVLTPGRQNNARGNKSPFPSLRAFLCFQRRLFLPGFFFWVIILTFIASLFSPRDRMSVYV